MQIGNPMLQPIYRYYAASVGLQVIMLIAYLIIWTRVSNPFHGGPSVCRFLVVPFNYDNQVRGVLC
jgi:hypothetical protein